MMLRKPRLPVVVLFLVAVVIIAGIGYWKLQKPVSRKAENAADPNRMIGGYDVLGTWIPADRARELLASDSGRQQLSPAAGAVKVTAAMINAGRKEFYEETFGDEYFLTDVLGAL